MNPESLSCPICLESYDEVEHEPNVVQGCGHTLCTSCIKEMLTRNPANFECPFCKSKIKMSKGKKSKFFTKNFALSQLIQEKSGTIKQDGTKTCIHHRIPIDLICTDCKCELCYKCAYVNYHKGHNVEMIDQFYDFIDEKIEDLLLWRKKAQDHNKNMKYILEQEQKNMSYIADNICGHILMKISSFASDFLNQTKSLNLNFFEKEQNFFLDDGLFDLIDKKSMNWTLMRSLDSALEINKINLQDIISKVEKLNNLNSVKSCLDEIKHNYFSKFFENLNSLIHDLSSTLMKQEPYMSDLIKISKYTKKSKDFVFKLEHPKKTDLKQITSNNLQEILNSSKKILVDLTDGALQQKYQHQMHYLFSNQNQIRSVAIKMPGPFVNSNFTEFFHTLPKLFDLRVLTLDLICCRNWKSMDLKLISASLKNMKLRKLLLSIMECDAINQDSVEELMDSICHMNKMISLSLCLDHSEFLIDDAFFYITNLVSKLIHLNHLKLSFHTCPKIGDDALNALTGVLSNLKDLSILELNLANTAITNKSASNLLARISKTHKLTSLELDFTGCDIHEQTIIGFAESILTLQNLEKFDFSINKSPEKAREALNYLFEKLHDLVILKQLRLDVEEGRIDHRVVEFITEDEKESMKEKSQIEPESDGTESDSDSNLDEEDINGSSVDNENLLYDLHGTLPINSGEASRENQYEVASKPKEKETSQKQNMNASDGDSNVQNKKDIKVKVEHKTPSTKKRNGNMEDIIILE